ncbi:MAG: 3D domain-containing protein [Lachnospiraceae bacterium]|nr:3D domain-containing protein [Lachnospiraceae bacterium]
MKKILKILLTSTICCLLMANVVLAKEDPATMLTNETENSTLFESAEETFSSEVFDTLEETEWSSVTETDIDNESEQTEFDLPSTADISEEVETLTVEELEPRAAAPIITLSKTEQIIPKTASQDLVNQGIILYKITVTANVIDSSTGRAYANKPIIFGFNTNSKVKLVGSDTSTNSNGIAKAYYEVRGTTKFTVTAKCPNVTKTLDITPAESCSYESSFYITAYIIALESDYSSSEKVEASGISDYKFRKKFLDAVKLNGSGYSSDNSFYIRYNSSTGKYEKKDPVTATGTTPTVNRTIAVDNYYIPRYNTTKQYGCVDITNIGKRKAEDAGGGISGYHIDVFVGNGTAKVNSFAYSNQYKSVKYLGNNKTW